LDEPLVKWASEENVVPFVHGGESSGGAHGVHVINQQAQCFAIRA
jgi:hypothetical protein